MKDYTDSNYHFTGTFNVDGDEITGELIYNKENGMILLRLIKLLDDIFIPAKSYGDLDVITGILNSGIVVTLFHNRRIQNLTEQLRIQRLSFISEYCVWSNCDATNAKYNKMGCVLENALYWSGLSVLDTSDLTVIKYKGNENENVYHWFGAKITFSTFLKNDLLSFPRKEESEVVERLVVHIEADEKQEISYFTAIRNRILSLISFAIKDNVNIEEQYLYDFDDSHQIGEYTQYQKHYLYTSEPHLSIHNTSRWKYNFTLGQLLPEKDIQEELSLLAPIFNLYLSLFKYKDMPVEMVFLNIVQALETFHSRFFYDNNKDKYVASVISRFGSLESFPEIEKLLLSNGQKNEKCKSIFLVSRLNDLLIGKHDGLFSEYYDTGTEFAQAVVNTRNYYTHYDKDKEGKALKGEELINAIHILALLLEYNICLQLGIDNREKVRRIL